MHKKTKAHFWAQLGYTFLRKEGFRFVDRTENANPTNKPTWSWQGKCYARVWYTRGECLRQITNVSINV